MEIGELGVRRRILVSDV